MKLFSKLQTVFEEETKEAVSPFSTQAFTGVVGVILQECRACSTLFLTFISYFLLFH